MRILAIAWIIFCLSITGGITIGWIGNVIDVINFGVDWSQGRDVASVIGIPFAPLGALVWWFF